MRNGDKKIFLDQKKLITMLNLRQGGLTLESLATLFNCDRMTITYHCKRYKIKPVDSVYDINRIIKQVLPQKKSIRISPTFW